MSRGTIEQAGTPQEIYDVPKNVFVAGFLNLHVGAPPMSFLDPRWLPQGERLGNVRVGVRPEDVEILGEEREGAMNGTVVAPFEPPSQACFVHRHSGGRGRGPRANGGT